MFEGNPGSLTPSGARKIFGHNGREWGYDGSRWTHNGLTRLRKLLGFRDLKQT